MVKMRVTKSGICSSCGCGMNECLDMFDVKIGNDTIVKICDLCMQDVFNKALSAQVYTNGRTKSSKDSKVDCARHRKGYRYGMGNSYKG
jgi:hypothetical protein